MPRLSAEKPAVAVIAGVDTYHEGYHKGNTGGLDAVDIDLATGNIKSGITIFGKVGSADILDVSDADAAVGDVKDPKTFYSVTGPRKTGTMPTVALAPGSSAYPAGYHAGDGGGLPAIDADLVTGNIKSGITIFNVTGAVTVQDIADADLIEAEAPTGKFFYSITGGRKTGTGTKTLSDANETVAAGYYAATTLSAVDAQLAVGNIKSGVTIFGFAGAATIQDISDADAGVGDVKDTVTFYSVTGARKTGTMPTVALDPGSSAYPAGYHAGDGGGLPAIDTDLATANIKSGITIFNVVGHDDVRDVSDADLTVSEAPTGKTFYAVGGARKTGSGTQTLSDASETVTAGYYAATTLSAVDAHLAVGNIKSGVTIFGFAGAATIQDISDADALVGDVKDPKTFYSVTGARKTGTMATVALASGSSDYPAGYHAGNVGGLPAIDADLATGNIKSGITIFNVVGHDDVRDVSDANALVTEVKSGRTFYAVGGARKTGTMPTQTLSPDNETVSAGYYAATTLSAVDEHLVVGNIKEGVTIFGKLGTFAGGPLAEDTVDSAQTTLTTSTSGAYMGSVSVTAGADEDLATLTDTFDADSLAVGVGTSFCKITTASSIKLRLYMGGVQMAETAYILGGGAGVAGSGVMLVATRALSGAQIVKLAAHNYHGSNQNLWGCAFGSAGDPLSHSVQSGSVKL